MMVTIRLVFDYERNSFTLFGFPTHFNSKMIVIIYQLPRSKSRWDLTNNIAIAIITGASCFGVFGQIAAAIQSGSYFIMKLQKFIQHYHRKHLETPNSRSPDRSYVFRTSESIGTLNSNDEFTTQRSFVVKDQSFNTSPNTQSIERLRQLCSSERQPFLSKNQRQQAPIAEPNERQPTNERQLQSESENELASTNFITFNKQHPKSNNFVKNKSYKVIETFNGDISFSVSPENQDLFYEQAPSQLYEGSPTEEPVASREQYSRFLQRYAHIMAKLANLEMQNSMLERQLQKSREVQSLLRSKEQTLVSEVSRLKESVSTVIQQNIQTENKIKQMLLKHQMQKYRFFSTEKEDVAPLGPCNSQPQLSLRYTCTTQKR